VGLGVGVGLEVGDGVGVSVGDGVGFGVGVGVEDGATTSGWSAVTVANGSPVTGSATLAVTRKLPAAALGNVTAHDPPATVVHSRVAATAPVVALATTTVTGRPVKGRP